MSCNSPEVLNTYVLTWAIENFSCNMKRKGEFIESSPFSESVTCGLKWTLRLYPRGSDDDAYLSFAVHKTPESSIDDISVGFTISIIGRDGSPQLSKEVSCAVFRNNSYNFCIHNFVERDDIINQKEFLLPRDTLTLQCVLKYQVKQEYVHSRIKVERSLFNWVIKNFSDFKLMSSTSRRLSTIAFKNAPDLELSFCLIGNSSFEAQAHIVCHKRTRWQRGGGNFSCNDTAILLLIAVSILDIKGHASDLLQSEHLFASSKTDETFRFPALIKRSELMGKKNHLLPNDELNLQIQLRISNDSVESSFKSIKSLNLSRQIVGLEPVLNSLGESQFDTKEFCDVVLKIGDQAFPVHKTVLSSQSTVFRDLIEADKNKTVLEVDGMDVQTLKLLLEFAYTSKLGESNECDCVQKLYSAASKYKMQALKDMCSSIMISKITKENVWDLSILAFQFGDVSMTEATRLFILKNLDPFTKDGWTKMMEILVHRSNQNSKSDRRINYQS